MFGLCLLAACEQSASHATPTKAPILDLIGSGPLQTVAETREILFGSGDRSHLLDGWSKDERDRLRGVSFVWATALEADLSFEVLDVTDQQFLVTLSAFPTDVPQHVTVLVNGERVSDFTAQPLYSEYRFVASARILRRGPNRLTFRHTELGTSGEDSRRFAAAYASILIGPQCLPLRANGPPVQPAVQRQAATGDAPPSLMVVGPAALRHRVEVPADAALRYRLALPPRAHAAAVSTVRVHDGERTTELVTRLPRPWFGAGAIRDVEVDLAPWSGKTVDVEIEVGPDVCRTAVATVVIDRAAVTTGGAENPS